MTRTAGDAGTDQAIGLIEALSATSRRPCSYEELSAALAIRGRMQEHGIDARLESFRSYETFAKPYGLLAEREIRSVDIPGEGIAEDGDRVLP